MGKLFGSGGSQSSTTTTEPWGPAKDILEKLLGQADKLFDANGGINQEFIDKEIADLNPELQGAINNLVNTDKFQGWAQQGMDAIQQGTSGIGQATGILGGLANQGITSEDITGMAKDLYNSELVASQKESLATDVQKNLAKSVQGLNQQAAGSGNMGSSRAGVAEGVAITGANEAIAQGNAAIENAASEKAMAGALSTLQGNQSTALGAGGQLGSLGANTLGQMGNISNIYQQGLNNALQGSSILQQYQQGVLNNKWFNATGQQNQGWNNINNLLGVAGSIGGMGGTTTQTGSGGGGGAGMLGGLMSGAGSLVSGGASAGWWSDARLKDELEVVKAAHTKVDHEGKEYPVPTLYQWKWNEKALALFEEHGFTAVPPAFGVLAQELEATGFEKFVETAKTEVEGLDGEVRFVNYLALCLYVGLEETEEGA